MSEQLARALEEKKGDRSLRALARDLGVAVGTAEGWLNGWRTPELENIPGLAEYLGLDVGQIVEWELEAVVAKNRLQMIDILGLATHEIYGQAA